MEQLTREQAIEFYDSEAWKRLSLSERAAFQLDQQLLCMPMVAFHEAMEHALGRPVWSHEFAWPERLRDEMAGKTSTPTFDEIVALLPSDKVVLVKAEGTK